MNKTLNSLIGLTIMLWVPASAAAENEVADAIAQAMGATPGEVVDAQRRDTECIREKKRTDLSDLVAQAALFAKVETYPGTGEMAVDFTRILVAQQAAGSGCDALALLWQRHDPLIRKSAEQGIGIAESDLAAAERLDALGKPYWKEQPKLNTRERVLAMWDASDPDEQVYSRLLLARLNAWVPAVEAAWDKLTDEERYLATRATFSPEIPDPPGQEKIVGHDEVSTWVWGGWLKSRQTDIAPYSDLLAVAETGYFGGRYFIQLNETYRMAIDTMSYMSQSMVTLPMLFDMMDMNAQY